MTESLADHEEVRAHLVAAARAGTPLTYSELLERLGYAFSRPKMRQLCVMLGEIDLDGEQRGEPELAVLVVRQSDGLPGQGWWVGRSQADFTAGSVYQGQWEGPEAARFVRRLQSESFAFWQSGNGTGAIKRPG